MRIGWAAILATFVTFAVTNVAGVFLFFRDVAAADQGRELMINPMIGITIYGLLGAILLSQAARVTGGALKAAVIIGASQFILVNVDFVMRGERGLMTAAASTALLALTWFSAAIVYKTVERWRA